MKRAEGSRGSVLLGVLMLVSFMLLCVLQQFFHAQKTLRFLGEELRGMPLRQRAVIQAVEEAAAAPAEADLCCTDARVESAPIVVRRRFCALCSRGGTPGIAVTGSDPGALLPVLHYNLVFSRPSLCDLVPADPSTAPLSPSAIRSARLCIARQAEAAAFGVRANLLLPEPIVLVPAAAAEPAKLAAAGYLSAVEIRIQGAAVIIAGGDLMISSLLIQAQTAPDVVLVSASGMVKVDQIRGLLKLKSISWLGTYLPGGHVTGEAAMLAPQVERAPLFISIPED